MSAILEGPKTEKEWQAQDDAYTLARAEEIKADENRLSAAKEQAGKMLAKEQEELAALRKVAGKGRSTGKSGNTVENQPKSQSQQTSSFGSFHKII
jgi:hypothetical protein